MKITNVETIPLSFPLEKPVYDANYEMATKPCVLVLISTDEGVSGLGESAHFGGPLVVLKTVIEEELKAHILGEDPLNTEKIWEVMHKRSYKHGRGGILISAISGIDIALWDIKGKVAGLPLNKLLGGSTNRIMAYATGGFYAEGKGLEGLIQEIELYKRNGFKAVKIKVGRSSLVGFNPLRVMEHRGICETSLKEDLERIKVARETLGDDILLMVDANYAWDVPTAIKMGRKMEKYDIYWFEEPVSPDDVNGSAQVASALDIPIAGYETCSYGRYSFRDYIEKRAIFFVQPDIAWSGGISECLKIAHLASAFDLPVAPHIHGSAVSVAASLHFMGAIPNASLAETVFPSHPLMEELVRNPFKVDRDGFITIPDSPGLGVELNPDVVKKYRV